MFEQHIFGTEYELIIYYYLSALCFVKYNVHYHDLFHKFYELQIMFLEIIDWMSKGCV